MECDKANGILSVEELDEVVNDCEPYAVTQMKKGKADAQW